MILPREQRVRQCRLAVGDLHITGLEVVTQPVDEGRADAIFHASDIEGRGWEVRIPLQSLARQAVTAYTDIYGNEYWEIKARAGLAGG